jgi:hypothetical protein
MDQKAIGVFVIGLIIGAILHHLFMGRQMQKQHEDKVQEFTKEGCTFSNRTYSNINDKGCAKKYNDPNAKAFPVLGQMNVYRCRSCR